MIEVIDMNLSDVVQLFAIWAKECNKFEDYKSLIDKTYEKIKWLY